MTGEGEREQEEARGGERGLKYRDLKKAIWRAGGGTSWGDYEAGGVRSSCVGRSYECRAQAKHLDELLASVDQGIDEVQLAAPGRSYDMAVLVRGIRCNDAVSTHRVNIGATSR